MHRDLDPALAHRAVADTAALASPSPGSPLIHGGRAAGLLAAILAAWHAAAGLPAGAVIVRWMEPAQPMHGWLALALALIGATSAMPARSPAAAVLRLVAAGASTVAAVDLLRDLSTEAPAGGVGPLSGLAWMAALALLVHTLWPVVSAVHVGRVVVLQACVGALWAICVAGLSVLVTGRLLLDWEPLAGGMSWRGVLVLGLLTASATARVQRQPAVRAFFAQREDRRIFTGYLLMLFGAVTVASSLVAGLLTARTVEAIGPVLRHSVGGHALALDHLIARLGEASRLAALDASLLVPPRPEGPADTAAAARQLRELRQQLDTLGQVGLRVLQPGRPVLTEGTVHDGPWVLLQASGALSLMAQNRDGLVLQVEQALPVPGASLVIQVRPLRPEAQLQPVDLLGTSAVVMLCADERPRGARCVKRQPPNDFLMPLPARADQGPWPIERAWRGADGVMLLRDPGGVAAVIAFAPVGGTGLGVVQKLPIAPLVQQLGQGVLVALAALLLVAGAGAAWLYRRNYPLLLGLRYAKAQGQTTLDHLPQGVLTLDAEGSILSSSVGAHRLFGRTAASLQGQAVQALVHEGQDEAGARPWQPAPGTHRAWVRAADASLIPVEAVAETVVFEGSRRLVVILRDLRDELARRAELARWERVFFHAQWGVVVSSAEDERLVLMNPAFAAMHGRTLDELKGRHVLDLFAPTAREAARHAIERIHEVGHARFESWHLHRDGHEFPVLVDATLVRRDDGSPDFRVVNVQDITEGKRAEAAVLAASRFFENLFHSSAVGMAVSDISGRFVRVNLALCELLGRSEEALLNASCVDVADPVSAAEDQALVARMLAGEIDKVEVERRWRRGDGRWTWVMVVASLVRLPDARQRQLLLQVFDIERSRRIQQDLRASRARLLNAHRIARLADWEWDPDTDELTLSAQGRGILGLPIEPAERLSGERWLAWVCADDRARVRDAWRAASQGGPPFALDYRLQLAGGRRGIHQQGECTGGRDGVPMRLIGVLQDISERKRIEDELLASRQRLRALSANEEAAMEQERRHIAREVHDELGQSLTALKFELSLLVRRFGADPALAEQALRMSAMVDGTIGVVRHVISNLRPSALDFGLVAAIEWLAEDFALRWEIPCDVTVGGSDIALDDLRATALFRMVQESLTNVARHAHARQVQIVVRSDGQRLHLSVRDDGVGFDPAQAQDRGGSFGLLGMRERALKIGARLSVDSRPGDGTTVRVDLPLNEA